jgi:hypothetical protein
MRLAELPPDLWMRDRADFAEPIGLHIGVAAIVHVRLRNTKAFNGET